MKDIIETKQVTLNVKQFETDEQYEQSIKEYRLLNHKDPNIGLNWQTKGEITNVKIEDQNKHDLKNDFKVEMEPHKVHIISKDGYRFLKEHQGDTVVITIKAKADPEMLSDLFDDTIFEQAEREIKQDDDTKI